MNAVILVYDVTSKASLEEVEVFLEQARLLHSTLSSLDIYLLGNKTDLVQQCQVTPEEAKEFATKHKVPETI